MCWQETTDIYCRYKNLSKYNEDRNVKLNGIYFLEIILL